MGQSAVTPQNSRSDYLIYTRTGCEYCNKVKKLLIQVDNSFDEVNCDDEIRKNKEMFFYMIRQETGKEWRTFPIVFRKGVFIGGYTETANYIDMQRSFASYEF